MRELFCRRVYWHVGNVGYQLDAFSCKLSVKLLWDARDMWLGLYWRREFGHLILFICLLPCLPIRLHWACAYGGRYSTPRHWDWWPRWLRI